jgi:hypothetical protein
MKRGWVYLVFGPTFGVLGEYLWESMEVGLSAALRDPFEGAVLAFVFGFFVSFAALFFDAGLARVAPLIVRGPLIAASGAAIACVFLAVVFWPLPHLPPIDLFLRVGLIAATSIGACSLLANDFSKE